jgi:hypothetical protein
MRLGMLSPIDYENQALAAARCWFIHASKFINNNH